MFDEFYNVSLIEVSDGDGVGIARKRRVTPIIDPHPSALDVDGVDGRVAAMLPVGVDLHRAHGQNQRSPARRATAVGEAILHQCLARMRERRRLELDAPRSPRHARDWQGAANERVTDSLASGRSMQGVVQAKQGRDLSGAASRFEIAIFVEQRLLGLIELP